MRTLRLITVVLLVASLAQAATGGFSRPTVTQLCPEARSPTKDWTKAAIAGGGNFIGIYDFEGNPSLSTRDSSSNENDLGPGSSVPFSTRSLFVRQGCKSYSSDNVGGGLTCDGTHCDPTAFCPVASSFTAGCWTYPFDVVSERFGIYTFKLFGGGFRLGWLQTVGSVGNLLFDIKRNSGTGNTRLLNFSTLSADTWYHHVGRYLYNGTSSSEMTQIINGVVDPNTTTVNAITACEGFGIGPGVFSTTMQGYFDECFYADCALDDLSICRIAVCGVDGKECSCDETNPDDYDYAPKHSSFGGPITCTLPACDYNAQCLTTTTTSTSTSTTSTTL